METVTITLNGLEVSGHPGMTILELARESGTDIPTLCHDPRLTPAGACRLCLVEDERSGRLVASCVTPISPGMVINTESPRVLERRKAIVKLMLASHPDSCLVCDKGNNCELRKIAAEMGIGLLDFERIPQYGITEEVNPFILRDLSKCILCAKCIRADQEMVVEGALDYLDRGFAAKPATLGNVPLEKSECTFCGICVAMCPTGALMEKASLYRGAASKVVETVCALCGCGCGLSVEVKDNRVVRARPGKDGVGGGTLCVRGSYGYDFIHSDERLTRPLVKVNGSFEPVSWENALEKVAEGFRRVMGTHGPNSLAVLGSSRGTNEENYLLQRFARTVLGTNNIDNGGRLYNSPSLVGLGPSVGFPGTTGPINALEQSDVILVVGADPTSSAPMVGYAIKRAVRYKGARLVLVDPRRTKLSSSARFWLKPAVGTDLALVNGLAKVIIDEGLLDEDHVARKTNNFEELGPALGEYTPEYVQKITGVPADVVREVARLFAKASKTSIVYGNGVTQQIGGTDTVMAMANLAMLTGDIGRTGGGIYALQGECNAQGASDMGALPDFLPGYQSVTDAQARRKFEECWGAPVPEGHGLTAVEMIHQAKEEVVRAMYVVGENPALSFPQLPLVREVLASLDFLVVQDMFLTETAQLADVVLPAASWLENEGTFTNFEGRVQKLVPALEPAGESMTDWRVVLELANTMNTPMPYSSLQDVMAEMDEVMPLYDSMMYGGSSSGVLGSRDLGGGSVRTRRLYKGHFPDGFGRFSPVQDVGKREKVSKNGYSFTLLAGSILYGFGSGSRSSRSRRLREFSPCAFVEICPADAEKLGIEDGDKVKVISSMGQIETLAKTTDALSEGLLFMPSCFPSEPVGELFGTVLDPSSKTPSVKSCAVKLERIDSDGQG
jgi:formate dehydrogenase alpha subunit